MARVHNLYSIKNSPSLLSLKSDKFMSSEDERFFIPDDFIKIEMTLTAIKLGIVIRCGQKGGFL